MSDASGIHAAAPRRSAAMRFGAVFALVALIGFALELNPWVDAHVVKPFTSGLAWLSGHLIQWAGGSVFIEGRILRHPGGFAVAIANGCSGLEAVILLTAAIVAFPAPWRARMQGVVIGALALEALNVVRVISLFYIGQYSPTWFDWAHQYAWDLLIMVDGLIVFLLWVRQLPPTVSDGSP